MDAVTSTDSFVQRLLSTLPEILPSYERTIRECAAEGLADRASKFVLDDYTRDLIGRLREGEPRAATAWSEFAELARVLETEVGVDEDLDLMINSSFVVLLPGSHETEPDVVSLLGPRLAVQLSKEREWRAEPEARVFVERMIRAFPRLEPDALENEYGEHGDVLIYIFLNDVVYRLVEYYLSGSPANLADVHAVLGFLEAEFGTQGEAVDNPIAVSFLEGLPYPGQPGADLVRLLGPKLRTHLALQRPVLP